jgi:hypothetical protein
MIASFQLAVPDVLNCDAAGTAPTLLDAHGLSTTLAPK